MWIDPLLIIPTIIVAKARGQYTEFWHGTSSAGNSTYNQLADAEDMEDLVDDIEDPANADSVEMVENDSLRLPTKDFTRIKYPMNGVLYVVVNTLFWYNIIYKYFELYNFLVTFRATPFLLCTNSLKKETRGYQSQYFP